MKRWRWALLIFELVLFALILVLPQVDLPDFTFHGGTAPVAAKARLSSAPVRAAIAVAVSVPRVSFERIALDARDSFPAQRDLDSRLSLLCSLLC